MGGRSQCVFYASLCVVQSLYAFSQRLYIADVRLIFQEVLTFFNWTIVKDCVFFIRFMGGEVNVRFMPVCGRSEPVCPLISAVQV